MAERASPGPARTEPNDGVIPVAAGLIYASGVILLQRNGFALDTLLVTALSMGLLLTKKVPAPLLVAAAIAAGFMIPA